MIRLTANSFIIHKEAESLDDCQDARHHNDDKGRYAIADGATRSFFPREWATLLVEHFCEGTDNSLDEIQKTKWQDWIAPIQDKWYAQVKGKVKERNLFYLTNSFNAQRPAVSTFIGIEFNKDNGTWEAMIVGDSCLFHRSDSGFRSYLIESSVDFTNRPEGFASFPKDNHAEPTILHGNANPGDTFILATDALAKWILEHKEIGKLDATLDRLKAMETDEKFYQFVHKARHDKAVHLVNDDVTLMLIAVGEVQDQLNNQGTEQRQSSEDVESQPKLLHVLLLTMVTVSLGFAAFCYLLYLFNIFFRD